MFPNRVEEAVVFDRAQLADALSEDIEFIAIVESSAEAITPHDLRKRLILLGGAQGPTEEEKVRDAHVQARLKMRPWEFLRVLYRLTPVEKI